jgi:hypothetical protein
MSLLSQVRLLVDLTQVQETIRYHVPHDICSAAINNLSVLSSNGALRGNSQLTQTMAKIFDIYRLPCLLGLRLMKSMLSSPLLTAAVESLLCAFELTLALVMWCHQIEQDIHSNTTSNNTNTNKNSASTTSGNASPLMEGLEEDEAILYGLIERTMFDCGIEKIQGRISPSLAIFVAELYEAIECWGLANVLSLSLRSFGYHLFPNSSPQPHHHHHRQRANSILQSNQFTYHHIHSPHNNVATQSSTLLQPPPPPPLRTQQSQAGNEMFTIPYKAAVL